MEKARPLVEDELLTHLCDQRDALMAGGMDETAATAESLRLTGQSPYEIGTELDRVHRPKTPAALFMARPPPSHFQALLSSCL